MKKKTKKPLTDKQKKDAKFKCKSPEFRVAFAQVFEPKAYNDGKPKFSVTMLFKKSTPLKALERIIDNAAAEKWGPDKTKWSKKLMLPIQDGDDKPELAGYKGRFYAKASSLDQPIIVGTERDEDGKLVRLETPSEFYSGCYAWCSLFAKAWENPEFKTKGVSLYLGNIQKLKDGKKFGGRMDPDDEFEEIDEEDNEDEDEEDLEDSEEDEDEDNDSDDSEDDDDEDY